MKRLLLACFCLCGLSAAAQDNLRRLAVTDTVASASTVTNSDGIINTGDSKDVALQFDFALAAATGTSSNITVTLQKTLDGTNWNLFATCIIPASGTTRVPFVTNFAVGAIPCLRWYTTQNQNTSSVVTLNAYIKLKREY
jgi:hypothetical protein